MISFFDILFVRTHRQYVKWKEKDMPGLYALMVVSLFQSLNILFFIILIVGSTKGENWSISKSMMTMLSLIILGINAFRIYKVIGIKKILAKYNDNLRLPLHPIIYFVISVGALVILRIVGIFPHIV